MDSGTTHIGGKKMQNEIQKAAEKLGLSLEEAQVKYEEICKENNAEEGSPLSIALWRSYAGQRIRAMNTSSNDRQTSGDLVKQAFGFFFSLEAPRDLNDYARRVALEEYKRDSFGAYQNGKVALAEEKDGGYNISRYNEGTFEEKIVKNLPACSVFLEDGTIVIPLDSTKNYQNGGENANFGKPLKETMRRTGLFLGKVGDDTEYRFYNFSYKNQGGVDFSPSTFEWLHMAVIPDSNREGFIYGFTDKTLGSLRMNADLDPEGDTYRNVSNVDMLQLMINAVPNNVTPLTMLDAKHIELRDKVASERFVITDGTVINMNMTPTANGNRIINLSDLNAEVDYEGDGMTTCWIPEGMNIDFGIGSSVVVVGRSSQRETEDGYEPATINVSGLLVTEKVGHVVDIEQAEEENLDWF